MALRGAQQRITPDVQIGCISCASGDGKFGQPVWWNTPLDEDDVPDAAEQHRAQWGQEVSNVHFSILIEHAVESLIHMLKFNSKCESSRRLCVLHSP